MSALDDVRAAFRAAHGREPDGVFSAPGRVNLIGEHTDHNEGHVLPFAIDRRTWVAAGRRSDRTVTVASSDPGTQPATADVGTLHETGGWAAYPLGTLWALQQAGVEVSFSQAGDASHNARKVRQLAGNAVANGLPWEAGLAGLTRVPAQALGVGDRIGTIAVGKNADLVLWTGDPLDVINTAQQVWLGGRAMPMRSRQTELRDRYLRGPGENGLPPAYTHGP